MEEEYQGRFKALKVIQNMMHEADEEEQKEIRKLEVEYERKYAEIYSLRNKYINAEIPTSKDLVTEFDDRAAKMKDDDYEKLEVTPCDVKSI